MAAFRGLCLLFAAVIAAGGTAAAQVPRRNPSASQRPPIAGEPAPIAPPTEMGIAAVVNDQVISAYDLISRIRMVEISSNLPDTPETRQRIRQEVLRSLIDEKLELEEAKKEKITATDAEINAALALIEKQNNMKPGQLNDFLKAQHLDRSTLVDQLTASIVWGKLVRRQAAETTTISDEEIDEALRRAKENAKQPESRVAEIFLAIDSPSQAPKVEGLAQQLIDQMRKGARFSAIAQQFSQSATAAVGGDMGWLRPDQLPPDLAKAVAGLRPGELSPPIRTPGGLYILLVLDRRNGAGGQSEPETVYDIVQVVFPLPPNASLAQRRGAVTEADSVRAAAKNCPEMLRIGKERAPQLSSEGELRASTIAPDMRKLIDRLGIGQPSPPIAQRNGVGVIMVCRKSESRSKPAQAATRDEVFDALARQRLDVIARGYLRDLRSKAYIDIRQ